MSTQALQPRVLQAYVCVMELYRLVTTACQSCACVSLAHSGGQELCSCCYLVEKARRHVPKEKGLPHQIFLRLCVQKYLIEDSRSGRNYKSESIRYSVSLAPAVVKPLFLHNIHLSLLIYFRWFKHRLKMFNSPCSLPWPERN